MFHHFLAEPNVVFFPKLKVIFSHISHPPFYLPPFSRRPSDDTLKFNCWGVILMRTWKQGAGLAIGPIVWRVCSSACRYLSLCLARLCLPRYAIRPYQTASCTLTCNPTHLVSSSTLQNSSNKFSLKIHNGLILPWLSLWCSGPALSFYHSLKCFRCVCVRQ